MHSGNGNRRVNLGELISDTSLPKSEAFGSLALTDYEYQQTFLPEILTVYCERGYDPLRLPVPVNWHIRRNGHQRSYSEDLEALLDRLEPIMKQPSAVRLEQGKAYVVVPKTWRSDNGLSIAKIEDWLNTDVQYRGVTVFPHFVQINSRDVTVLKDDNRRTTLNFYEFHTALEKWLPKATKVMARLKNGSNGNC